MSCWRLFSMLACLVVPGTTVLSAVENPTPRPEWGDLAWLEGTWVCERGERTIFETWLPPTGDAMFAVSRTIAGGRTVAHEFIILRRGDDGRLTYEAYPSGQAAAEFRLTHWDGTEAVFANPAHDFPQRVIYMRLDADTVRAAIEGERDGKLRRVEFLFRRDDQP